MFTSSLFEESKSLQEDIAAVAEKVNDPAMCEKVRQFVYGPKEIQSIYREDAGKLFFTSSHENGLIILMFSGGEYQLAAGHLTFE